MKITFLGTNGFYPTETGDTVCVLIETDTFNIILDAGSGLSKLDSFDYKAKETFIFLSHLHLDHISGLFTLPKFNFEKPLKIFAEEKTADDLKTIVNFPYMCPVEMLGYKTEIISMESISALSLPFRVEFLPVIHSVKTFGFRFTISGKTLAYVTDTGVCDNAVKLAEGADLLILECSHLSGESNSSWPHINPQEAPVLATKAKCKRLVINHFDSNRYKTFEDREKSLKIVKKAFPQTLLAHDLLSLEL